MNCLRLPSMEVVSLANIRSFPLSIFNDLPNIKTIRLTNMGVLSYPSSDISTHSSPQVLSILDCEEVELRQIISWAKTRHLHSLEFRPEHPLDFGYIVVLLQACSISLTCLDLDLKSYCMSNSSSSLTAVDQILIYLA